MPASHCARKKILRGGKELAAAPVVVGKRDLDRMAVSAEPGEQALRVRAAPLVDGLVEITAEEDIRPSEQPGEQPVFRKADILHLVDMDVPVSVPPEGCGFRIGEQSVRTKQQVGKIEQVARGQLAVVQPHDRPAIPGEEPLEFGVGLPAGVHTDLFDCLGAVGKQPCRSVDGAE